MSAKECFSSAMESIFVGKLPPVEAMSFPDLDEEKKIFGIELTDIISKYLKENVDSEKLDLEGKIPDEIIEELASMGLFGLSIDEDYGGLGLDYSLYARIFEEVTQYDGSIATTLGAHQSIGLKALQLFGNQEQKDKWLPKLATGESIAAFALTEPAAGSDAFSIQTRAVLREDGNYVINGQKIWITNAGMASFYTVFCKTEHVIEGETKEKITAFIVEKDREGISFGEPEKKLGIRASETRAIFFDNVVIPPENVIGKPGRGFKIALSVLNIGRLSLAACSVGAMKTCTSLAINHAKERAQFGQSLLEFEMIQEKVSRMLAATYTTQSLLYYTTGLMNKGMKDYSLETAICKIAAADKIWFVSDEALQIAGGTGYMREYPFERWLRDTRINRIFEGTNEILKVFLSLTGMKPVGKNLGVLKILQSPQAMMKDPKKAFIVFGQIAGRFIKRSFFMPKGLNSEEKLEEQFNRLSVMIGRFGNAVEKVLLKHGKKILDKQFVQHRIAQMAIEIYSILAVLLRTESILKSGIDQASKDYYLHLAKISFSESEDVFWKNLAKVKNNRDRCMREVTNYLKDNSGVDFDILKA